MASLKRGSDEDSEGTVCKMSRKDDSTEDDGSRSKTGRIRKKSAKVLEMEEFEEAEKKQFTKKSDTKGKITTVPVISGSSAKKSKIKFVMEEPGMPGSAAITAAPNETFVPNIILQSPVASDSVSLSPLKSGSKQAVATKIRDGQGSVIKLLLSSPAMPTPPSVTTSVLTKTSPPTTVNAADVGTPAHVIPSKKGVPKLKTEPLIKQEAGLPAHTEGTSFLKVEPMDTSQTHLLLDTALTQEVVRLPQTNIKSEPGPPKNTSGSLKMKLMMSPKDSKTFESIFPTSVPIPNIFGSHDETDGEIDSSETNNPPKTKSGLKKKKSSIAGEKVQKQSKKHQTAAQQMPNLAALVTGGKGKKSSSEHKDEMRVSMSDGVDTSMSDASLDMSSIVDSALDMEEEAALVIAEGVSAPKKHKKKRIGGPGKKKTKAISGDFDSDEGSSAPPEGDIAALAAKVQGSGVSSNKKKYKKHQELTENASLLSDSKKKRPPRRAPTAYMLYCNAQRPKVVSESPGIDFAQISRTLGVMWQCLSKKEKMMWRRKSKKLAGKGSTLISTGKGIKKDTSAIVATVTPTSGHQTTTAKTSSGGKTVKSGSTPAALSMEDAPLSPVKGFGIEPIDIAAHLKLLGESLSIIGMRLQEHKGLIAVQGSLSVLLDSLLCACGPLIALTQQIPGLDGCSESTHARTLDSVAYIMPGL